MPELRGKFIREIEQSMPLKRKLTVLLWADQLTRRDLLCLLDLDRLRILLESKLDSPCSVRLLVPSASNSIAVLTEYKIPVTPVEGVATDGLRFDTGDANLQRAIALALAHDVDYIVTPHELLPYIEDVDQHYYITLTDITFLLRCVEVFVRGFDVPWSFSYPALYHPFTTFYLFTERTLIFQSGFDLMNQMQAVTSDNETIETGRTLVFNRLCNLCLTRDRLLFYSQQRQAALRNGIKRQEFKLETAYYLNFYYLLLYGTFDHAAMLVNAILKLPLKNRDVGAAYPKFLTALQARSEELHTLFTKQSTVDLLDKFAALRHYAAHRGSIAPALIVEAPDKELSDAEVDEMLKEEGGHEWLLEMEDGTLKEGLLKMLRSNKRGSILEQNVIARDVMFIEIRGQRYQMQPLNDITWNFDQVITFARELFSALRGYLSTNAIVGTA